MVASVCSMAVAITKFMNPISNLLPEAKEPTFEDFYGPYPKKANKVKAEALWNKLSLKEKCLAVIDVHERKGRHAQWKDKQYVPGADVYLRNKKWTDEIITARTRDEALEEAEDGTPQSRFWTLLIEVYGERFKKEHAETMPWVWRRSLETITGEEIAFILRYLTTDQDRGIPDLPKINRIRAIARSRVTNKPALQLTNPTKPETVRKSIEEMMRHLK